MYKIKLVQENPKVGDIQGNLDLAKSHITEAKEKDLDCLLYTSPSPRDSMTSRMPSSA